MHTLTRARMAHKSYHLQIKYPLKIFLFVVIRNGFLGLGSFVLDSYYVLSLIMDFCESASFILCVNFRVFLKIFTLLESKDEFSFDFYTVQN